ncbi:hypothetical protein [Campylobacter magnus]|nr:hypothetical protein [Campylobacter magnus]MDD0856075.1 hypothetical protein [Campylobacter magnus]
MKKGSKRAAGIEYEIHPKARVAGFFYNSAARRIATQTVFEKL